MRTTCLIQSAGFSEFRAGSFLSRVALLRQSFLSCIFSVFVPIPSLSTRREEWRASADLPFHNLGRIRAPRSNGYRNTFRSPKSLTASFWRLQGREDLRSGNPHNITHICNCTTEPLTIPSRCVTSIIQMDQLDGHDWDVRSSTRLSIGFVARCSAEAPSWPLPCWHKPVSGAGCDLSLHCGFDFDARSTASRPSADRAAANVVWSVQAGFGISACHPHCRQMTRLKERHQCVKHCFQFCSFCCWLFRRSRRSLHRGRAAQPSTALVKPSEVEDLKSRTSSSS